MDGWMLPFSNSQRFLGMSADYSNIWVSRLIFLPWLHSYHMHWICLLQCSLKVIGPTLNLLHCCPMGSVHVIDVNNHQPITANLLIEALDVPAMTPFRRDVDTSILWTKCADSIFILPIKITCFDEIKVSHKESPNWFLVAPGEPAQVLLNTEKVSHLCQLVETPTNWAGDQ